MAARYWVGGTAAWDGTAGLKWSLTSGGVGGQAVPTSADDVFFDAVSGANTVTISTGNTGANSITCTGFTGTLTGSASLSVTANVTLVAGMTFTYSGTLTVSSGTITSAGKTFSALTLSGSTVTLGDALSVSGLLSIGTSFTTNNFAVSANSITATAGTGTLTLGSSTITLSASGSPAFTIQNQTLSAGTSNIVCTANTGAVSIAVNGAYTLNNLSFTGANATSYGVSSTGATTFNSISFPARTTTGISNVSFTPGNTYTIASLTFGSGTGTQRLFVQPDSTGTVSISCAAVSAISDVDFKNISVSGTSAPWSGTRLGNCTGNTNITFPAAKTVYWNLGGANNWSATGWAATTGGAPAVANFPLAQDTAVIDNSSAGVSMSMDAAWNIGTISATRTTTFTIQISTGVNVYGGVSLTSSITVTSSGIVTFTGSSTSKTLTSNGGSWSAPITVAQGQVTLGSAINAAGAVLIVSTGTTLSCAAFTLTVLTANVQGTLDLSTSGTLEIFGTGAALVNSGSITGTNSSIYFYSASAKTFSAGSKVYTSTVINGGAGALSISGSNTFTGLSNIVQPTTFTFSIGTTTTVTNFNVSGTAGNLVTINSPSGVATLSKASGTVNASYLSISNSTATGGATWNALNSTNGGGNTGWIFSTPATANFLMMFM